MATNRSTAPSINLTDAQLQALTGFKVRVRQADWLKTNGVPYRADAGGRLIVLASHVEKWVAGVELRPSTSPLLELVR
jgi:hypothetical protein